MAFPPKKKATGMEKAKSGKKKSPLFPPPAEGKPGAVAAKAGKKKPPKKK